MNIQAIYTEKSNCQDCYKCIRQCPVKAIKIEDHSASIIPELCIECGHCILICPKGAKRFRNDVNAVKMLLQTGSTVIASIAPSYTSEYDAYESSQFISALKKLGFWNVSETALGADIYNNETVKYLSNKQSGLFLSSCCPSVVNLIQKYYPQHEDKLLTIPSPMYLHAQLLKEYYGNKIKVVFIGPCISKKTEATINPGLVDAVLTYTELNSWLEDEKIVIADQKVESDVNFMPYPAKEGHLYPIDGGLIEGLKKEKIKKTFNYQAFSGTNNIKNLLNTLGVEEEKTPVFLELMACAGGCVNGPTTTKEKSILSKIINTRNTYEKPDCDHNAELNKPYFRITNKLHKTSENTKVPDEEEIQEALQSVGKTSEKDELNCSGCGYESCRSFALALLLGKAERSMCVSYMRKVAHNKASVLLQKMPYGVFMVDEDLKIIESNYNFAKILGSEVEDLFADIPGLEGACLDLLIPSNKLFSNFISSGEESLEKDIRINKKIFHLSLFTIQKHKILCGLIQSINSAGIIEDEVVKRTRAVIQENLSTVQKVAYLLGENASRTEVILNSIIESHSKNITDE
jgi:iron only hydrogenase large subunit-like protein